MEHSPLQWSYSGTAPQNTWVPPQIRGLKKSISESDCDDAYSETSSKDPISPRDAETDSCQHLSRKKRRGVIEKKRRDRINSSLSELKRLVPSAYEKQGSTKLEKAEILQLTVDHLKTLHAKGTDSFTYDPQRFAMDYHIIGFRECASEVARYLLNIEGMDIQDPFRMRIMSHLQCFVAQRELSAKSATSQNWSHSSYQSNFTPASGYQQYSGSGYIPNLPSIITASPAPPSSHQQNHNTSLHSSSVSNSTVTTQHQSTAILELAPHDNVQQQQQQQDQQTTHLINTDHDQQQHYNDNPQDNLTDHQATSYIELSNIQRNTSERIGYGIPEYSSTVAEGYSNSNYNPSASKPYRPWGAEMAY